MTFSTSMELNCVRIGELLSMAAMAGSFYLTPSVLHGLHSSMSLNFEIMKFACVWLKEMMM